MSSAAIAQTVLETGRGGIAVLGYLGGANPMAAILYGLSGILVGCLYVVLHRYLPFTYSTLTSEAVAGAVIVGGLAWL